MTNKPKSRDEFIENLEDEVIEEESDGDEENAEDESEYMEEDALKEEFHIKSDVSYELECLNYDNIKKSLLKTTGVLDISESFVKVNRFKDDDD